MMHDYCYCYCLKVCGLELAHIQTHIHTHTDQRGTIRAFQSLRGTLTYYEQYNI